MDQGMNEVRGVLQNFYQKVFIHAYELGQEFPDSMDSEKVFDPCNAEDQLEAELAILAWHKSELEKLGENR